MNHAIVLAAQQYLGFELCNALLERGWTVTAVDDDGETNDKWLEIGRNANIQYVPTHIWDRELPRECRLFLPYYDQLGGSEFECLALIEQECVLQENLPEIVRIFSNQSERKKGVGHVKDHSTTFYLPTLYGAHQPSQFLFSQLLRGQGEELQYVDDPSGAIYVKDAADSIIKHSGGSGTYSLKSLSENSWKEALSYITDQNIIPPVQERRNEGESIVVHPSKSHESILRQQKQKMNLM